MRNLVAAEMAENPGKYKAKSFSGRGNRRANSNRNRFDWRSEMNELDMSDNSGNNVSINND